MSANHDFGDIQVFTGQEIAKAQQQQSLEMQQGFVGGALAVDQARAVAEVQAAMVIARMNPRNEIQAYNQIIRACKRKSLAESAKYAYKRGGTLVTGPSIRLAEVLARSWGNMTYGLRELSRGNGSSIMQAFAWDLETNTRVTREFEVRHIREKQGGNVTLTSERDIYELSANMGQRRVRACILEIIPGDIVEAAEAQCDKTLREGDGTPFEDRLRNMVVAFSEFGVTGEMIEKRIGHKLDAMVPAELVQLTQIYRSLRDGMANREEFFDLAAAATTTKAEDEPKASKKGAGKAKSAEPEDAPTEPLITCPTEGKNPGDKMKLSYCLEKCKSGDCKAIAEYNESIKE